MSEQRLEQRLVDGVTGEYVTGHSQYGVQGGQYITGSTYTTGNQYTSGTVYQGGAVSGTYQTSGVVGGYQSGVVSTQAPQVVNTQVTTGKQVIKGESRIEYVPFEKKIVEYKDEVRVERVPRTRKVT